MKVLIADDHPLMLAGLRSVLETTEGFEIVGEAHSGPEVLPLIGRTAPDVVLLDLLMPGIDGLRCLDRIKSRYPEAKVVALSESSDPELIQSSFRHGACGYVVKGIELIDLPSAIRQAVEGTAYHAHGLPAMNDNSAAEASGLSERELCILKAVAKGLSNDAIAKELWVTVQTVKFHLTHVYSKLGVANRTQAAGWAFSHGLTDRTDTAAFS